MTVSRERDPDFMKLLTECWLAACLTFAAIGFAQAAESPLATDIVFRFAPPDGVRVHEAYRRSRTVTVEGQSVIKDELESTTAGVFVRAGTVWHYLPKIVTVSSTRNGQPADERVRRLLSKAQPSYVISDRGEAISVDVSSEIEELAKYAVPSDLVPLLTEEALIHNRKAEWNSRYAVRAGRTVRIGDVSDGRIPIQLANGEFVFYKGRTRFVGWEKCPAGNCVRIEQIYDSASEELTRLAQLMVKNITETGSSPSAEPPTARNARLFGMRTLLIDPNTMLIYSNHVRRSTTVALQFPGRSPVPSVDMEERTYTYTYE